MPLLNCFSLGWLFQAAYNKVGKITKKEIMELCPDISRVTVERTLTDLVKSGYIAKVGAGSSTGYVRI